jgi:ribonucleoside-triphosphate reductase
MINKKQDKTIICKHCGSTNVYGISRVVGYFSRVDQWNKSKIGELKARQRGDYSIK